MADSNKQEPSYGFPIALLFVFQFVSFVLIASAWNATAGDEAGSDVLATSITALEVVVGVAGIGLGLAGFLGYNSIRRESAAVADEAARTEAEKAVSAHLDKHGVEIIKECLSDAVIVSRLQIEFQKLGIDDADDADDIDSDPSWEDENGGD